MENCLKSAVNKGQLRFGFPMWYMDSWRGNLLSPWQTSQGALTEYAQVFTSVEGNTTFYGLPDAERVKQWRMAVPDNFRFCFKLPREVSHADNLCLAYRTHRQQWLSFTHALGASLGCINLQLPASFSPARTRELYDFLSEIKSDCDADISVEFRHPAFFNKNTEESELLRALSDLEVSRTIFDSRGLFIDHSATAEVLDARAKKPRMPVHPVATGRSPVVRFIGHSQWDNNRVYLEQWLKKLESWISEGRTPYFFIHTAGNTDVQYFFRFIENMWFGEEQKWPGEQAAGHTNDLFG